MEQLVCYIIYAFVDRALAKPLRLVLEDADFGMGNLFGKHISIAQPMHLFLLPCVFRVRSKARDGDDSVACQPLDRT